VLRPILHWRVEVLHQAEHAATPILKSGNAKIDVVVPDNLVIRWQVMTMSIVQEFETQQIAVERDGPVHVRNAQLEMMNADRGH
jgi:hypothetical protein